MPAYSLAYGTEPTTVLHFVLAGDDLNPHTLTQALGVQPDQAWAKGDLRPSGRPRSAGRWGLTPHCARSEPFEVQLSHLLTRLEALPVMLSTFIQQYGGTIIVGYSSAEANFGFSLERATIARLARLGVSLDFDLYPIEQTPHDTT